jgi:hypothetical protein
MKQLITIALILAAIFASTFVVIKATGILTIDDVRTWLTMASEINPIYVALAVIILLFSDLFIAVPNLTICILCKVAAVAALVSWDSRGFLHGTQEVTKRVLRNGMGRPAAEGESPLVEKHHAFCEYPK